MLWNFQNFALNFVNGEWCQQKEAIPQNNINITFLILIMLFQKITNKSSSENWLEVEKLKLNFNTEI